MKLGETKRVFAWWPIPRLVRDGVYFKAEGRYWICEVTLMWTFNGWVAYASENE